MAERYVDQAQFLVVCYSDRLSESYEVEEAWCVSSYVGSQIDTQGLTQSVEEHIEPEPFHLQDRWSHFSWGADASAWQLVVEIASVLGGVSGVAALILEIADRIGSKSVPMNAEQAGVTATDALASLSHLRPDDIEVEDVSPLPGAGFNVHLQVKRRKYSAIIGPEGLWQIRRIKTRRGGTGN